MSDPLCFDGYCGLGGWAEGFLAEGWRVIGFDVERHDYGTGGYPGELVLQNMLTVHGSQLKDASCLVFSPPCTEFSYIAMPWKRGKAIGAALRGHAEFPEGYTGSRTISELTALFDACFRIQREASEAAGRYIPMVVENVKGAQPWVGKAKANWGSFYLWGDVGSIGGRVVASRRLQFGMPTTRAYQCRKLPPEISDAIRHGHSPARWTNPAEHYFGRIADGRKVPMNFHDGKPGRSFQSAAVDGLKVGIGSNYERDRRPHLTNPQEREMQRKATHARRAASAQIAKIPFELASYIARAFKPEQECSVSNQVCFDGYCGLGEEVPFG